MALPRLSVVARFSLSGFVSFPFFISLSLSFFFLEEREGVEIVEKKQKEKNKNLKSLQHPASHLQHRFWLAWVAVELGMCVNFLPPK